MPTAPGGKPFADEPRHYVALASDAAFLDALETAAHTLNSSMASTSLYCAIKGLNPLLEQKRMRPLAIPAYLQGLEDRERALPGLDRRTVEAVKPSTLRVLRPVVKGTRKPSAKVGFLAKSQMPVVGRLATKLGTKPGPLTTWAVLQHLNVLLDNLGEEPVALPGQTRKKMPPSLLASSEVSDATTTQDPLEGIAKSNEEAPLAS